MKLICDAIQGGNPIPRKFACDGENISPAFRWEDAPKATKSFALIVHDPDAPRHDGFFHWMLYNISPSVTEIRENVPKAEEQIDGLGTHRARMIPARSAIPAPARRRARIAISRVYMRFGRDLISSRGRLARRCALQWKAWKSKRRRPWASIRRCVPNRREGANAMARTSFCKESRTAISSRDLLATPSARP